MRIVTGVVGLFLSFAATALAADTNDFKPFTPKDGGFTISFPGKPEISTFDDEHRFGRCRDASNSSPGGRRTKKPMC